MAPAARAWRRKRRASRRRSIAGRQISKSSAMTTIAVAARAMATARRPVPRLARAAGGAREEDHALGPGRDLVEGADHLRLAPAARRDGRDRGPHPLLELRAELRDEALVVLAHGGVALG